ncbi:hypothetical protein DBR43_32125 [Pedobacter sp. KBW06]|uniref:hypothetical protein n=1 Tax=Pedobacter sp. KBW06 TaxID=2153359 RepID=UPI000F5A41D1|nr:hypothetical protein [Pedobacter sp. KBW06]RQO64925.1 hypothetical protein DBR43_32125 [Pedobacter sp. KBW06]
MIEDFSVSEKYRKYLIGLQFNEVNVYTVWGTDMLDEEEDKLLIKGNKLLCFKQLNEIRQKLSNIEHPFLDVENFEKWVVEEELDQCYNTIELKLLSDFNLELLNDKFSALEVLGCLNLIQDFSIQTKDRLLLPFFDDPVMVGLKDFMYNDHFWKKKEGTVMESITDEATAHLIKRLYDVFYTQIIVV